MSKRLAITSAKCPRFVRRLIMIISVMVIREYTARRMKSMPKPIQCISQAHCHVRSAGPHFGTGSAAIEGLDAVAGLGSTSAIGYPITLILFPWKENN